MSNRLQQLADVQKQALHFYGESPPEAGSVDHVVTMASSLRRFLDSEVRHVTLTKSGLADVLCRVFVECLCALRGRDLNLADGRRRKMTMNLDGVCVLLREEVFAPKNAIYGDSFADYGAVGVVIRLLDKVRELEKIDHKAHEPISTSVAHVANYATMALMILVENDPEFLA
jgi:hypothetical protein